MAAITIGILQSSDTKRVKAKGVEVVVFEPTLDTETFYNSKVIKNLEEFKRKSTIIIANRISTELEDVAQKIFRGFIWI